MQAERGDGAQTDPGCLSWSAGLALRQQRGQWSVLNDVLSSTGLSTSQLTKAQPQGLSVSPLLNSS